MPPEQLQSALNALMGAGLDDETLTAVVKVLTDAFGSSMEVSDDSATEAMPAGMRASYNDSATSAEDKASLLDTSKHFLRAARMGAVPAMIEKAKLAANGGKGTPEKLPTLAEFKAAIREEVTKTMPGAGRAVSPNGNPVNATTSADKTGFSAKMTAIEKAEGCKRPTALLKARKEDPKAFNAWVAAGRPE